MNCSPLQSCNPALHLQNTVLVLLYKIFFIQLSCIFGGGGIWRYDVEINQVSRDTGVSLSRTKTQNIVSAKKSKQTKIIKNYCLGAGVTVICVSPWYVCPRTHITEKHISLWHRPYSKPALVISGTQNFEKRKSNLVQDLWKEKLDIFPAEFKQLNFVASLENKVIRNNIR